MVQMVASSSSGFGKLAIENSPGQPGSKWVPFHIREGKVSGRRGLIGSAFRMLCTRYSGPLTPKPGRVAQSVGHLTCVSGVLGSIPGLATYFRFSFRFFKKSSCQLLAKVCARSTG